MPTAQAILVAMAALAAIGQHLRVDMVAMRAAAQVQETQAPRVAPADTTPATNLWAGAGTPIMSGVVVAVAAVVAAALTVAPTPVPAEMVALAVGQNRTAATHTLPAAPAATEEMVAPPMAHHLDIASKSAPAVPVAVVVAAADTTTIQHPAAKVAPAVAQSFSKRSESIPLERSLPMEKTAETVETARQDMKMTAGCRMVGIMVPAEAVVVAAAAPAEEYCLWLRICGWAVPLALMLAVAAPVAPEGHTTEATKATAQTAHPVAQAAAEELKYTTALHIQTPPQSSAADTAGAHTTPLHFQL